MGIYRRTSKKNNGNSSTHRNQKPVPEPTAEEQAERLQNQCMKAAFANFTGIEEHSLPAKERQPLFVMFRQASLQRNDFPSAEGILLGAFNIAPENPYIALRLAYFYKGSRHDRKAANMAEKARFLAGKARIPLEALEAS